MQVLTAAASEQQQRRAAGALHRAGLRAGDRVAICAPPGAELISVVLGALRTGVVPVLIDPALPPAGRVELLTDADPGLVLADAAAVHALLGGPASGPALAPAPRARPMHYTSGTTGRRKGVWSGLLAEAEAAALVAEEQTLWGFGPGDRHLVVSPLHHSAPLRFATATLLAGGTVLVPGRFDPEQVLHLLRTEAPDTIFCVPAQVQRLCAVADATGVPLPLGGLRLVAHAGAPCPPPLKERLLEAAAPGAVREFYGSTEGQFTVCTDADWRSHPGTVGRARPGRILHTVDGVVWCAAPAYTRFSYWRDEAATAAAWAGDRFTVGDLGRLDDAGFLYLDGRRSDLIISGGVNVYPLEVERALAGCPGVVDIAVFGVPDERWGQRVAAAVVGTASAASLRDRAVTKLPPAGRPKSYHRIDELPRTSSGKVRRVELAGLLGLDSGRRSP